MVLQNIVVVLFIFLSHILRWYNFFMLLPYKRTPSLPASEITVGCTSYSTRVTPSTKTYETKSPPAVSADFPPTQTLPSHQHHELHPPPVQKHVSKFWCGLDLCCKSHPPRPFPLSCSLVAYPPFSSSWPMSCMVVSKILFWRYLITWSSSHIPSSTPLNL